MELVNPFEERVLFGKAYPLAPEFGSQVRTLTALVPTGRHVGHALDLKHVSGPKSGGRKAGLEHYRRGKVGKAFGRTSKGVKNGLRLIEQTPKPTKVAAQTFSAPTPRLGPPAPKTGKRLA